MTRYPGIGLKAFSFGLGVCARGQAFHKLPAQKNPTHVAVRLIEYNEPHKRFITDYQFTTVKTPLHVLSKQLDVVFLRNQQLIIPKVLRTVIRNLNIETLCLPASTIGLSSNILSQAVPSLRNVRVL